MDSRHQRHHRNDFVTHEEKDLFELRDAESKRGAEQRLGELEEEFRRLRQLVCDLLSANQVLGFQILQQSTTI
jgi:hypothetical protein